MKNTDTNRKTKTSADCEFDITRTPMLDLLEIAKAEYDNEQKKKSGFESRAGLILAFIGAMCIFWLDQISPTELYLLMDVPLTFAIFTKIICGIIFYISFVLVIILSLLLLGVRAQRAQNTNIILGDLFLTEQRWIVLRRVIKEYREIINDYRNNNETRARLLKWDIRALGITILSSVIWNVIGGF